MIPAGGGFFATTFTGVGDQRDQGCIHPWMRTTVNVAPAHGA
jgi:hypothetical protein